MGLRVRLEDEVIAAIRTQADRSGYPPTTYMERVVGLAHRFESPFMAPPIAPLPIRVDEDELRAFADGISPTDCGPGRALSTSVTYMRLDEPLAVQIQDWCDAHSVTYGGYLASILRLAAGYRSAADLPAIPVQPELLDVSVYGGERARAS